jgi:hypothetical protein
MSNGSLTRTFNVHATDMALALKHGSTVPNRYANAGLLLLTKEVIIIDWIRPIRKKSGTEPTHKSKMSE